MTERITYERLSKETGEPEDRLRRWHELGLLPGDPDAFPLDHLERVRLIQFAERRGTRPERLAEISLRYGDLLATFLETLSPEGRSVSYSFDEAAGAVGIERPLVERMRVAAGLLDQEVAYEEDLEAMRLMSAALSGGLPEEAVLQLVRVFADASGRMAEAVSRLFHLYVHERFRAEGRSGADLLATSHAVSQPLRELVDPTIRYFHRKAWDRAVREDMLLHLTEDTQEPSATPGQLVCTVLFCDLASFTPMTEAMGDTAAAGIVDRFSHLVRHAAAQHHGQIVKQIGDEFMVVFGHAGSAVACALAVDRAASAEPNFPAVRSGAHRGSVLYREADYVGATVNLAARVGATARAHQVLVTEAVRSEAAGMPGVGFSYLGKHRLKGVGDPTDLFLAETMDQRPRRARDPVCGMELDPERAAAQLVWEAAPYWFCSPACLQRFAAAPERYVTASG